MSYSSFSGGQRESLTWRGLYLEQVRDLLIHVLDCVLLPVEGVQDLEEVLVDLRLVQEAHLCVMRKRATYKTGQFWTTQATRLCLP